MKKPLHIFCAFLFLSDVLGQTSFIEIESNKVLSLLSFMETAAQKRATSFSFQDYIIEELGHDSIFMDYVAQYDALNIEYSFNREEYPDSRNAFSTTKDLIWIASTEAINIDDFGQRIVGYLPHHTHVDLLRTMKGLEPYFDQLIWSKEQESIERFINQIEPYKRQIEEVFFKISSFYGAEWHQSVPFKIELYPIPLERGDTRAIPKGNNLICGFLSYDPQDYIGRLGVIIHEMCHILFEAQPASLQHNIDGWLNESSSDYAAMAYAYIDEGLATALGNGWAYEYIHGELDTFLWYADDYIDGFAHGLYPLVKNYIDEDKSMDEDFVNESIEIFKNEFPKAINDTDILLSSLQLYANATEEDNVHYIAGQFRENYRIRSMWFSTPINDQQSISSMGQKKVTKVYVIEKDHEETFAMLQSMYESLDVQIDPNSIYSFIDTHTKSTIIVINLASLEDLSRAMSTLRSIKYIEFNKAMPF